MTGAFRCRSFNLWFFWNTSRPWSWSIALWKSSSRIHFVHHLIFLKSVASNYLNFLLVLKFLFFQFRLLDFFGTGLLNNRRKLRACQPVPFLQQLFENCSIMQISQMLPFPIKTVSLKNLYILKRISFRQKTPLNEFNFVSFLRINKIFIRINRIFWLLQKSKALNEA